MAILFRLQEKTSFKTRLEVLSKVRQIDGVSRVSKASNGASDLYMVACARRSDGPAFRSMAEISGIETIYYANSAMNPKAMAAEGAQE